MRQEEKFYTELSDLGTGVETTRLAGNSSRYTHLKHGAGKVLVDCKEIRGEASLQIPSHLFDQVKKFIGHERVGRKGCRS